MRSTILSIKTSHTLHTLQRIMFIFKRNQVHMEQLNIYELKHKGIAHFSVILQSEPSIIEKCVKQLKKIVEILDISISHPAVPSPIFTKI
jgi:acetolactate synthase small subunit